jgi:uncharacterized protein with von Willebrand factor type A (vWA) domain
MNESRLERKRRIEWKKRFYLNYCDNNNRKTEKRISTYSAYQLKKKQKVTEKLILTVLKGKYLGDYLAKLKRLHNFTLFADRSFLLLIVD